MCRENGDVLYSCLTLGQLGLPELRRGNGRAAEGYLTDSVATAEQIGAVWLVTIQSVNLGYALLMSEKVAEASAMFRRSLVTGRRAGLRDVAAHALIGLGLCAGREGNLILAAELHGTGDAVLGVTEAVTETLYTAEEFREADQDQLRLRLGEGAFDESYHRGAMRSLDDATALVLGRTRPQ